uniref:Uncharacterized protein n=1 Tax=Triticum urartu TaxID=4572 RepID=A0A8R7Q7K1_TRIUA
MRGARLDRRCRVEAWKSMHAVGLTGGARSGSPPFSAAATPRGTVLGAHAPLPQLSFLAPPIHNSLKTLHRRCLQSDMIHCSG